MTDQPSPALAEAREAVAAMTAKPFIGVVIEGDDTPPILFSHEDNVAGANRAVALLRTVVAEETVGAVAAVMGAKLWHGLGLTQVTPEMFREYAKEKQWNAYCEAARAVLTALLERAREGT